MGLDHWYTALDSVVPAIARSETVRLVAVAHDDLEKARSVAGNTSAELATTDYRAALERADVDLVVAMFSTDRNVEVCSAAAAAGKHILSVKPMAMDLQGADTIVRAVREAGVVFLPSESSYRLTPGAQRIKNWIADGRIGTPVRYTQSMHSSLPRAWPGEGGSGWWVDPQRVPGGGWIDHAIYAVDLVRWIFRTEIVAASGIVANRRHADLPVEDYGIATFELDCGAVAVIEDTWTAERGFGMNRSEYIGSAGAIVDETGVTGRLLLRGDFGFGDWIALEQQRPAHGAMVEHLAACVRQTVAPISDAEAGRANLAACLAFYQAAQRGGAARSAEST